MKQVLDEFPSMQPVEIELIFGRFMRGSTAARSQERGSGLGMALVRVLIEAMGGH